LPTNERLEFLGDAVLGLVVTDRLFRAHPDLAEGDLAKLRAGVVNMKACAEVATELDLGAHLLLGRGEETTGGRSKASILADAMEAVIGSVYVEVGLPAATDLIQRLFDPLIERAVKVGAGLDWKTSLQELTAERGLGVPNYRITETGPDHAKVFEAHAVVAGSSLGDGRGSSKKDAEQQAAANAFRVLSAAEQTAPGPSADETPD